MLSEQFIWFGALVNFLAGIGYVIATVRGQARPNRVSWGLWSVTSWLAFLGQLDEGVGSPAVLTLTVALIPSLIFLASFVGGADWQFSKLDMVCGGLAVLALLAWQLTASGIVAIVLSIAVDALAGIPTVVKAYREPESESHVAYTAGMFSAACTLLTLQELTIATSAFAIYFFTLCGTVSFLLLGMPRLRRATRSASSPPSSEPPPVAIGGQRSVAQAEPLTTWRAVVAEPLVGPTVLRSSAPLSEQQADRADRRVEVAVVATVFTALAVAAVAVPLASPQEVPSPSAAVSIAPAANKAEPAPGSPSSRPVATSIAVPTVHGKRPVGPTPGQLQVAPDGRLGLIAHRGAGVVSVFDIAAEKVTATITVSPGAPWFITFSPDGARAYLSIYDPERAVNLLGVLDMASRTVVVTIPVGRRPMASAVSPDGSRVWVPSHDDGVLDVIDTATNAMVGVVAVPPNPQSVAFSDDGRRVYVADDESNVVTVLDAASTATVATIPVGTSPQSVVVAPRSTAAEPGQVAVVSVDASTVSMIDTATDAVVADVPVGKGPQSVAYAPDGRYLYTANVDDDSVSVIDTATHTVTATVPVCDAPTSVTAHPSGRFAYVTCLRSGEVIIFDSTMVGP